MGEGHTVQAVLWDLGGQNTDGSLPRLAVNVPFKWEPHERMILL